MIADAVVAACSKVIGWLLLHLCIYNWRGCELLVYYTTELTVPYGNDARVPVQKYRDLLKMWNAMMDGNAIYVILGAERTGSGGWCAENQAHQR